MPVCIKIIMYPNHFIFILLKKTTGEHFKEKSPNSQSCLWFLAYNIRNTGSSKLRHEKFEQINKLHYIHPQNVILLCHEKD